MAILKVQSAQGSGANPSFGGVLVGDLLTLSVPYIIFAGSGSATPSVADSSGQSWLADNVPSPQGTMGAGWVGVANFSLPNANAGAHNLTVSLAGSTSLAYATAEWSGLLTSSVLDQTGVTAGSTFGTQTMTVTAAGATTTASELVIVAMAIETNSGASAAISDPPSGYAGSLALNNTWQSSNFGYESAYELLSTTGTPSATWNWTGTGTTRYQSVMSTYKAVVAGGGGSRGGSGLDGGLNGGFQ